MEQAWGRGAADMIEKSDEALVEALALSYKQTKNKERDTPLHEFGGSEQ